MSRAPPPLIRLPAYPVTGGVGLIAAAVTVLTVTGRWDLARFTVDPTAFTTEPWRLVVSAFPHACDLRGLDVFHLPFNLYWLWRYGTRIEDVFGHVKALGLVILLAAGSAMAEYALFRGGIGLSGVTFGLFGALGVLTPRDPRFEDMVDARATQIMVGWFLLCIAFTAAGVWAIANVAHAVGALLGVLVGMAVAARRLTRRLLATASIQIVLMLSFVGATRPSRTRATRTPSGTTGSPPPPTRRTPSPGTTSASPTRARAGWTRGSTPSAAPTSSTPPTPATGPPTSPSPARSPSAPSTGARRRRPSRSSAPPSPSSRTTR
jgi:membrane associated rhomboid family serine protease